MNDETTTAALRAAGRAFRRFRSTLRRIYTLRSPFRSKPKSRYGTVSLPSLSYPIG
ncbi:MAG: hypothetical protein AVDCRST_MAG22-1205 [uncultured Rubrobacteraceae bacterium]|uniref:Uncharacterized protein n=1 Tax=uncultured Rubrobacteraceae bacterium TaxID=349277 RepID=A0A6J4P1Z0_9ACTN|nr:MAG: hypothetical protein AVDCRST_MAG22-1205 [uncultured Rubrobacteraceae bacterium]